MDEIIEISVEHGQPPLLYSEISKSHSNNILVYFVGWLFHVLQTLANQSPLNKQDIL